jgi:hypothetical protein
MCGWGGGGNYKMAVIHWVGGGTQRRGRHKMADSFLFISATGISSWEDSSSSQWHTTGDDSFRPIFGTFLGDFKLFIFLNSFIHLKFNENFLN